MGPKCVQLDVIQYPDRAVDLDSNILFIYSLFLPQYGNKYDIGSGLIALKTTVGP